MKRLKIRFGRIWGGALVAAALVGTCAAGQISDIDDFLDRCPQNDPAFATITHDFHVRRNGQIAAIPACSEPVSALPTAQYTDVLVVLQGLRAMYYMDRGQHGHLPWTPGTLYDWMKTKIKGFDIVGSTTSSGGYCCESLSDGLYMVFYPADDFNRDFDRGWAGILDNITFYAHEARHVDGFPHVSCCGITNGCDQTFDPANLSPYGIQWWINDLCVTGVIDVGLGCLPQGEADQILSYQTVGLNDQYRLRFCTNAPAEVAQPPASAFQCVDRARGRLGRLPAPTVKPVGGRPH
jgi:hypothetical protein